jgi:hypothetical protein
MKTEQIPDGFLVIKGHFSLIRPIDPDDGLIDQCLSKIDINSEAVQPFFNKFLFNLPSQIIVRLFSCIAS